MSTTGVILPDPLPKLPKMPRDMAKEATTHSSAVSLDSPISQDSLACLGSAALAYAVTLILQTHPDINTAGDITKFRATFVDKNTVTMWAKEYGMKANVAKHLFPLDETAADRIICSCFHAHLGAVSKVSHEDLIRFIRSLIMPTLTEMLKEQVKSKPAVSLDCVRQLNEYLQKNNIKEMMECKDEDAGIDVTPRFEFKYYYNGKMVGKGSGDRKKEARQRAADQVLKNHGRSW